jgi:hypothetical protein
LIYDEIVKHGKDTVLIKHLNKIIGIRTKMDKVRSKDVMRNIKRSKKAGIMKNGDEAVLARLGVNVAFMEESNTTRTLDAKAFLKLRLV